MREVIIEFSERLQPFEGRIKAEVEKALFLIGRYLPTDEVRVTIKDNPDEAIAEVGGIGGFSPGAYEVIISVDPAHPRFSEAIESEIVRTLTHEVHHAIRWNKPGYGETLFDALVSEGLADHFVCQVTPGDPEPWATALSDVELVRWEQRARGEYDSKEYSHEEWFFGSAEKGIPRWTGYALGYSIVGRYLAFHPDTSPAVLVDASSEQFER